ncbi:hypothetical protein BH20ACI1_BH20ACI1_09500 [soil metagenome]
MTNEKKERLLELLSDQAIFDLNEEELMELEQLKKQFPDWKNYASFELTAAAIGIANIKMVAMPDSLRTKILNNAEDFLSSQVKQREVVNSESETRNIFGSLPAETVGSSLAETEKRPFWQWLGWGVAFAACALLAINLWTTRIQPQSEIAQDNKIVQTPTPELNAFQKRDQFIATAPDIIRTKLESPNGAKEISGDVVWSNSQQKGYVTFRGMPVNNPSEETYQLWVFDEAQNDKYPISGGVFDVGESGEIVVPIDTELKIQKPKMFAVTEEKPGGVVVSDREKLLAIAKI